MKFTSDIDIDFANRSDILKIIKHTSAGMIRDDKLIKHITGIYVTDIPVNPLTETSSLDYKTAEERGYVKLDFLNVWVYKHVRDENHLIELMSDPDWSILKDRTVFEKIIHIGNHYDAMMKMSEPIDSIPRMAMFLSIIRPGKRHLIGKKWSEIVKTVWNKETDGYVFKKAHAISYSWLVAIHMNLLKQQNGELSRDI